MTNGNNSIEDVLMDKIFHLLVDQEGYHAADEVVLSRKEFNERLSRLRFSIYEVTGFCGNLQGMELEFLANGRVKVQFKGDRK